MEDYLLTKHNEIYPTVFGDEAETSFGLFMGNLDNYDWIAYAEEYALLQVNKEADERIAQEISLEEDSKRDKTKENIGWSSDYHEGFIDGLKRAKELLNPKN